MAYGRKIILFPTKLQNKLILRVEPAKMDAVNAQANGTLTANLNHESP
jgi:hypothetical protein